MTISAAGAVMTPLQGDNPIVFYHADCMDGLGAAWAVHDFYMSIHAIPVHYGDIPDYGFIKDRLVYIVDFSFPVDVLVKMAKAASHVILLDHHKTAQETLSDPILADIPNLVIHFDMTRSGAMITWNWFNPHLTDDHAPMLIQYIQDRDLWKFELENTKPYLAALALEDKSFDNLTHIADKAILEHALVTAGHTLLKKQAYDITEIVKHRQLAEIDGYTVPIVNCPPWLASDVGSWLVENTPEGKSYFSATYFDFANVRKYSLRSSNAGVDVSAVAKKFGGGGHWKASGFTILKDITKGL